jgi:RNA polymerase sigma factor (sigma-70 family)
MFGAVGALSPCSPMSSAQLVARLPLAPAAVPAAPGDVELCSRALAGSGEAWSALFTRHNHRVVVALLARGVRIDRAKELAQDAWILLIERQRAGRLERLILPGLVVAQAVFLARDDARLAPSARPHLPLADAEDHLVDLGREEQRLLSRDQLAHAGTVLATCSDSAQRVFRLLYERPRMGHREVAERVGLSVQRVRQILCEVRKKLRAALEE